MIASSAWAAGKAHSGYVQTNLVSDVAMTATTTDANLLNAWGIAFFPGAPFWVNDNGAGVATLYDGIGTKIALTVMIPLPPGSTSSNAAPTGIVANPTAIANVPATQFLLPTTSLPALFIFDTEDGTIAGWNFADVDPTKARLIVDNSAGGSSTGAVYKGLAMGVNSSGVFLFASNFRSGKVDVFDSKFNPATLSGSFSDPGLPSGFAPFGIANIRGNLFVTYALQNSAKHDDVSGPGHGFVDVFDTNGNMIERFATRGHLNSPWGIAAAPLDFGKFSGDVLIGNFGDGKINAFDPTSGHFHGQLKDPSKKEIVIDGLWGLSFGGAAASDPGTLYFTAGPNNEMDGLFGSIAAK
jgi:uncharacterized protein (TIGR03118 family)